MNTKHVVILLIILTNVISVGLVLLFLSSRRSQQEKPVIPQISTQESNNAQKAQDKPKQTAKMQQEKPKQTAKMQIDSIISHYNTIKSGRYRELMETYKQAIRNEPPYTADSTIARIYAEQGNYKEAIKSCEKEIQRASAPEYYYTLAWIYAKTGEYNNAIYVCNETIRTNRQYSKIFHVLGWVYAKMGENNKALDACNNAIKLEPHSAWGHYGLGRIYLILEKPEKAIESYKKAIQLQSDFLEAHLFLGLTYAELGEQKDAIDSYRQAMLLDNYYPETYFFLGVAYDESGQYKKAIKSFEQANDWYDSKDSWIDASKETKIRIHSLGIKPDLANIYCIIGACHLRLDQPFKASLAFKDAIDFDDSHVGSHYGLALTHILLGDKNAALMEYEAVKKLDSERKAKKLLEIINN